MHLCTDNLIRAGIPSTLQDAYKYFDETISKEDKEYIKNGTSDNLLNMHFGLGLWIRNNWAYPADDRIAKGFSDKGVTDPDAMSGYIITGYKLYLNGQPCEIDDIVK